MSADDTIGRYQIQGELGRGGMGRVFRAFDPKLHRVVAVKTMRLDLIAEPSEHHALLDRFRVEAQAAAGLSHPNIVTIYDFADEGSLAYIVMEFIDGQTGKDIVASRGRSTVFDVLRILRDTASALDYAHQLAVYHRDVKPVNIMVRRDGLAKLTDFGIAKIRTVTGMTASGMLLGTPHYMPPEHLRGLSVDGRGDQFSLGVVAYELLTGQKPFDAPSQEALLVAILFDPPREFGQLAPDFPPAVGLALNRALAKQPDDRYATCTDLVRALADALSIPMPMVSISEKDWQLAWQREQDSWQSAKSSAEIEAVQRYLAQYPSGRYAAAAANLAERLERERRVWAVACIGREPAKVREFLATFPSSASAATAVRLLADLENESWSAIAESFGATMMERFLAEFPDGQSSSAARERLTWVRECERTWREASETRDAPSLRGFLERYGASPYASDARRILSEVEAGDAWLAIRESKDQAALAAFLGRYPNSKFTASAEQRWAQLEAERKAWTSAAESLDAGVIGAFLERYPDAAQSPGARRMVSQIEEEERGWGLLNRAYDAAGLVAHLAKYPGGKFTDAARLRLTLVDRHDKAWIEAQHANEAAAVKSFLASFPDTPNRPAATELLVAIEARQPAEATVAAEPPKPPPMTLAASVPLHDPPGVPVVEHAGQGKTRTPATWRYKALWLVGGLLVLSGPPVIYLLRLTPSPLPKLKPEIRRVVAVIKPEEGGAEAAWEKIKDTNDDRALESFLANFPQSKHLEAARHRLEALRLEAGEWTATKASGDPQKIQAFVSRHTSSRFSTEARKIIAETMSEKEAWDSIKDTNDEQTLESFLRRFPKGPYAGLTAARIKELRSAEANAWTRVRNSLDPDALRAYVAHYPQAEHVPEANQRLSQIDAEAKAWKIVSNSGDINAFESFLAQHPNGAHGSDARHRLESLRTEQTAWSAAKQSRDPTAVQAFVDEFPNSGYAGEARRMLAATQAVAAQQKRSTELTSNGGPAASPPAPVASPAQGLPAQAVPNLELGPVNQPAVKLIPAAKTAIANLHRNGKIIWVGSLPADGLLDIDAKRASSGNIVGELPGVPVRVAAWPARLGGKEITIFSPTARPSEGPNSENGGRENVYKADLKRASEVSIIESPSAQNGWKRLSLHSKSSKLTAIVIEWELMP
ncbi:MAG: protein kinase [Bryobacteraceae bacterium]